MCHPIHRVVKRARVRVSIIKISVRRVRAANLSDFEDL